MDLDELMVDVFEQVFSNRRSVIARSVALTSHDLADAFHGRRKIIVDDDNKPVIVHDMTDFLSRGCKSFLDLCLVFA